MARTWESLPNRRLLTVGRLFVDQSTAESATLAAAESELTCCLSDYRAWEKARRNEDIARWFKITRHIYCSREQASSSRREQSVKRSTVQLLWSVAAVLCVVAFSSKSAVRSSADVALTPISYSSGNAGAHSGPSAKNKQIRLACYPVFVECTKDSDCCTGFCRVGRVTAYCDHG